MTDQDALEQQLNAAYTERAHLLAWLAMLHHAVLTPAPDIAEPGWQILYLNAAGQQMSWHISPRDMLLLGHVEQVPADDPRAQWDGHTTEEKYRRIRTHARSLMMSRPLACAPVPCDDCPTCQPEVTP